MDDDFTPCKASEWLVALNEDPDDIGLRTRFEVWLSESPAHTKDWAEMTYTHQVIGRVGKQVGSLERNCVTELSSPVFKDQRKSFRTGIYKHLFAAGIAVAACFLLFLLPSLMIQIEADYITSVGKQKTVRLEDGSSIHLGPESAVTVDYTGKERRIRLLKGRAFFEVTPNAARPFRVASNEIETTVLGTTFDVRLHEQGADVGVRSGHVRVNHPATSPPMCESLEKGEWIQVGWNGNVRRGSRPAAQIGIWQQGHIIAKDRSVAEVIDEIRPWYHGIIILRGDILARQPLTGVYNVSDPVEAVRAIATAQGARMLHISPWVLVISGN
ncbi:MAG: FecR domain-containing protein [Emcibacter sp.]|nr:FecR domain-containing protein [Emcibacter sp.]